MAATEAELGEVLEMELVGKVSEVACFVLPGSFHYITKQLIVYSSRYLFIY